MHLCLVASWLSSCNVSVQVIAVKAAVFDSGWGRGHGQGRGCWVHPVIPLFLFPPPPCLPLFHLSWRQPTPGDDALFVSPSFWNQCCRLTFPCLLVILLSQVWPPLSVTTCFHFLSDLFCMCFEETWWREGVISCSSSPPSVSSPSLPATPSRPLIYLSEFFETIPKALYHRYTVPHVCYMNLSKVYF